VSNASIVIIIMSCYYYFDAAAFTLDRDHLLHLLLVLLLSIDLLLFVYHRSTMMTIYYTRLNMEEEAGIYKRRGHTQNQCAGGEKKEE